MTLLKKGGANELVRRFPSSCNEGCGDELALWDSVAQEVAVLSGTEIKLFSLRRAANHHPLYKEPSDDDKDWEFNGPWEMMASLQHSSSEDVQPEATDSGKRVHSTAIMFIPRANLERVEAPFPKIGDVVEFWAAPPFAPVKSQTQWDVTKAEPEGTSHQFSSNVYTEIRVELAKRGKFVAARKTENTRI